MYIKGPIKSQGILLCSAGGTLRIAPHTRMSDTVLDMLSYLPGCEKAFTDILSTPPRLGKSLDEQVQSSRSMVEAYPTYMTDVKRSLMKSKYTNGVELSFKSPCFIKQDALNPRVQIDDYRGAATWIADRQSSQGGHFAHVRGDVTTYRETPSEVCTMDDRYLHVVLYCKEVETKKDLNNRVDNTATHFTRMLAGECRGESEFLYRLLQTSTPEDDSPKEKSGLMLMFKKGHFMMLETSCFHMGKDPVNIGAEAGSLCKAHSGIRVVFMQYTYFNMLRACKHIQDLPTIQPDSCWEVLAGGEGTNFTAATKEEVLNVIKRSCCPELGCTDPDGVD